MRETSEIPSKLLFPFANTLFKSRVKHEKKYSDELFRDKPKITTNIQDNNMFEKSTVYNQTTEERVAVFYGEIVNEDGLHQLESVRNGIKA